LLQEPEDNRQRGRGKAIDPTMPLSLLCLIITTLLILPSGEATALKTGADALRVLGIFRESFATLTPR
jgi:hypothetical protein